MLSSVVAGMAIPGFASRAFAARHDFRAAFGSIAEAQVIGRAYLRAAPHESDPKVLLSAIFGDARLEDPSAIRSHLSKVREADFIAQRVTVIRGWVMSVTEARWCALSLFVDEIS
jgi:hypothetical protein